MAPPRTPQTSIFAELDPDLLDQHLAGTCSPAQSRQIDRWMAGNPARRAALTGLRRGLAQPSEYPSFTPVSELGARVATVTAAATRARLWSTRPKPSRRGWHVTLGVGLGAFLMTIGGYALLRSDVVHVNGSRSADMISYVTRNGQRAEITLPDGSTVVLNVASRLDVPANFAAGNHALRLQGEALFTTAHHTSVPLTVTAGTTTARVLGTSFVVRRYMTDTTAIVTVRDGRVAVGSTVIGAQQQIIVNAQGRSQLRTAPAGQFTFATGVLTLDRVPLADAISELNRWYDADIRVADPVLLHARIRATFPTGSLSDLSTMLEFMLGARVTRDGRILTIDHR